MIPNRLNRSVISMCMVLVATFAAPWNLGCAAVSISVKDGQLRGDGVRFERENAAAATADNIADGCRFVPGPLPGITGIVAAKEPVVLRGQLAEVSGRSGTLAFWFATDRAYRSGSDAPKVFQKLAEIPGSFTVSFLADQSSVTLFVEWAGPKEKVFPHHIRIILPEIPGPAWHHFALSWDGVTGEINAFLDGTSYYVPGEKHAPMEIRPGRELALHVGNIALADVTLDDAPLADAQSAPIPASYRGQMDRLLGSENLGTLSSEGRRGKTLFEASLANKNDISGWILEGPGSIVFRDGWMEMKSQRPDGPEGHIVLWSPRDFPENFVAEWEFEMLDEHGLCILFFCAKGRHGEDALDSALAPRNGVFKQYTNGDIDCYHISYYANSPTEPRRVANLRKNHGFYLLSNGPVGALGNDTKDTVHRALLIKDGGRIQMAVNGKIIIDATDDGRRAGPVLVDGKIGFRQMQWTHARYRNFRVSELRPALISE